MTPEEIIATLERECKRLESERDALKSTIHWQNMPNTPELVGYWWRQQQTAADLPSHGHLLNAQLVAIGKQGLYFADENELKQLAALRAQNEKMRAAIQRCLTIGDVSLETAVNLREALK